MIPLDKNYIPNEQVFFMAVGALFGALKSMGLDLMAWERIDALSAPIHKFQRNGSNGTLCITVTPFLQ